MTENLKTPPGAHEFSSSQVMHEDISGLTRDKLDFYVRLAFLDESNTDFLPPAFWSEPFERSWGRGDGNRAKGAAEFFGDFYGLVGRIAYQYPNSGEQQDKAWIGYPVKPEFRAHLRSVLGQLLDEALDTFPPTDTLRQFALCSFIATVQIARAENSTVGYPDQNDHQTLYKKARELTRDKRFQKTLRALPKDKIADMIDVLDRSITPDAPISSSWLDR